MKTTIDQKWERIQCQKEDGDMRKLRKEPKIGYIEKPIPGNIMILINTHTF